MKDILKGFVVGLVSLLSIFIMMVCNIYLQNYIKDLGGWLNLFLLTTSYLLAYTWPFIMLGTILWSIRLLYRVLTKFYPRIIRKVIFINLK